MLLNWILTLLVNAISLMVVAGYFPAFHLENVGAAFLASFILSIFDVFMKPILVFLSLPVILVSFGLFSIVINAVLLLLTAEVMGSSFEINGFGTALIAAIIVSVMNILIKKGVIEPMQKKKRS
ncbi:Conserved membrane protein YvlD [Fictibacillus macauensis ZFHKF-1]|uniref:Conserved membrane protein YvlD n=1 Tax=Fictibacillus macauensis ZFHKF-1 TaxID=1196324 RepID=I8AM37_9BACL|nr:phage holin family protein [Fictibacillus macauensis]EIT87002.1 Conserved membrane protein YvlD [Fictibacillus macauensis ZFHKF-1]